jgi:site-specific DNA recombinase
MICMTKAAVYLRTATENHSDGASISAQRCLARQYCARHETDIWAFYMDEGVSGLTRFEHRPAGARLLEDARAGKFDLVLIHSVDRLGRKLSIIHALRRDLEALGIAMQSLTEWCDPDRRAASAPVARQVMDVLHAPHKEGTSG